MKYLLFTVLIFYDNESIKTLIFIKMFFCSSVHENHNALQSLIEDVYPTVLTNVDLLQEQYPNTKVEIEWIKKVMNHNIHREKYSSVIFLATYVSSADPKRLTSENIKLMCIYGMCFEMVSKRIRS